MTDRTDRLPTVSVVIPAYNEEQHIEGALLSIAAQTYPAIAEVLVIDGRSTDRTHDVVGARGGVRLLDNPRRIQSSALNIGIRAAVGDVVVRIDGHCTPAPDYVARAVEALLTTGASMVGGAMTAAPADGTIEEGIAMAMMSPFGAGPARFHTGGEPGWVDTVYLGVFRREDALAAGGYSEEVGVNEDAEFAIRLGAAGGVWFDPAIRSTYVPRRGLRALARQFYRYGLSRAATAKRHPGKVEARQLAAPALVVGLVSPVRRPVVLAYFAALAWALVTAPAKQHSARVGMALAMPVMHLCWGVGFILGLIGVGPPSGARSDDE